MRAGDPILLYCPECGQDTIVSAEKREAMLNSLRGISDNHFILCKCGRTQFALDRRSLTPVSGIVTAKVAAPQREDGGPEIVRVPGTQTGA